MPNGASMGPPSSTLAPPLTSYHQTQLRMLEWSLFPVRKATFRSQVWMMIVYKSVERICYHIAVLKAARTPRSIYSVECLRISHVLARHAISVINSLAIHTSSRPHSVATARICTCLVRARLRVPSCMPLGRMETQQQRRRGSSASIPSLIDHIKYRPGLLPS